MEQKPRPIPPGKTPEERLAGLVIEAARRTIVHYGLWFHKAAERLGVKRAAELEAHVGDSILKGLSVRLSKILGLEGDQGLQKAIQALGKETLEALSEALSLTWLSADGFWFQALEAPYGMGLAKEANDACWDLFSPFEAIRIKQAFGMPEHPGLEGLKLALGHRLYARINRFSIEELSKGTIIYRVHECRVQDARKRKGLRDYPCKSAGLVEHTTFASAIDQDIETACMGCPPDPHPEAFWCAWQFRIAS